jgi:hypothetical protein
MVRFTSALWRLALALLLVALAWQVWNLRNAPAWIEAQIEREGDATRAAALCAISDTRVALLAEIDGLRKDALEQASGLRSDARGALAGIAQKADDRMAGLNTTLDNQLSALRASLGPSLDHVTAVTARADEASAVLLRRDALPAQILGVTAAAKVTLGETAQTMRTIRVAAPQFVKSGQQVAVNANRIAGNINRLTKPRWYDRLLGYGLNGAILFRELHPAANLAVQGARIVSSRP